VSLLRDPINEERLVLQTDWEGYVKILEAIGDGNTRVTYANGRLELMSPSERHEALKKLLGGLIEQLVMELNLECRAAGSMTFKAKRLDKGFEPDECYWIGSLPQLKGEYEPLVSPPPDLVVEVDVSRSWLDRGPIYAAFVWRSRSVAIRR
jgi:Uma2 family endonuclease